MRDLVEYVARALVDEPDEVRVEERQGTSTFVVLTVAPEDLGRMIGRQGRTAKALRTLVSAKASLEGRSATLEIRD
ncbi:MAG TPA: KH domain-containing protein [Vulgatibacter sp.]|nr:KH domain-containing protein [Vulgatibacter sp.]